MKYLALGDSYTIGESVPEKLAWPHQLAAALRDDFQIHIDETKVIAKTGWTTAELQSAIQKVDLDDEYELVSLSIGVNNQYRGQPFSRYETEFVELFENATDLSGGCPGKVFVVSIPDYGVTPFAKEKGKDAKKIAKELDQYNAFAKKTVQEAGAEWIDITPISRSVSSTPGMLAEDELHPSEKMYELWVMQMAKPVAAIIKASNEN